MSLLIDDVEMQVRPYLFFWVAQGRDELPDARGEDLELGGIPGIVLGEWVAGGRRLELRGWIQGMLLGQRDAGALRAQVDMLKRLLDPSRRVPVLIRDLAEDGLYRTMRARPGTVVPYGSASQTPDTRNLSIELQGLDPAWQGVGGVPMDTGYLADDGLEMDAGEEITVTPTSTAFAVTVEVLGSARPNDVHIEFIGSVSSKPGLENLSLPEGVVSFTVTGALGPAGKLVVDTSQRVVERNGANARKDMTLGPANRAGEYFSLQPGTNELRILGRPTTFRLRYTPAYL